MDRRAARTRAALTRALVSLVRSKGYEAATVAEVCAAADVGRSTFYAHYAGKDDLKRRAMAVHLREVIAHGGDGADGAQSGDPFGFSLPLLSTPATTKMCAAPRPEARASRSRWRCWARWCAST
jgi:AcrR family transcriptional regulator